MKNRHLIAVTRTGQITIPAEYRRALRPQEGDKVAVSLEDRQMAVVPNESVTERTAGLLGGERPILSAEGLWRAAEQAIADAPVEGSGG